MNEFPYDKTSLLLLSFVIPAIIILLSRFYITVSNWFTIVPYLFAALGNYYFIIFTEQFGVQFSTATAIISAIVSTIFWFSFFVITYFFRDPERISSASEKYILSPADGRIKFILDLNDTNDTANRKNTNITFLPNVKRQIPKGIMIGIEMLLSDVHIQRSPVSGRVVHQSWHTEHNSNSICELLGINRRILFTVLKTTDLSVGILQISSCILKRILPFKWIEDAVDQGERFGAVQSKGRIVMIIEEKDGLNLNVSVGERVSAGDSIIAELN